MLSEQTSEYQIVDLSIVDYPTRDHPIVDRDCQTEDHRPETKQNYSIE